MKRHTITLPMLIFIAVLLVSMAVFPTAASGTAGEPDAVAGSGAALSLARQSETFDIIASAHNGGLVSPSVSKFLHPVWTALQYILLISLLYRAYFSYQSLLPQR